MIYELDGQKPDLPEEGRYWVAPSAAVIGKVRLKIDCSIWFGAVLRGDNEWIELGERSQIQDNSTLHTDPGFPTTIGPDCVIGHNVILHGCTIGHHALIGMGAIVLNGARVGRHSIIAAGTVLAEGQQVPEGVLVAGVPGKVRREVSEGERAAIERNAGTYVGLSQLHRRGES